MAVVAKGGQQSLRQQAGGQLENPRPDYATGTVYHDTITPEGELVHHHQRFDRGLLVEWERDDSPAEWALVRHGSPFESFASALPGEAEVDGLAVRIGDDELTMPPLDDLRLDGWDGLPHVPDATARLKFELTGSPAGPLALDIRYVDGARAVAEIVDDWAELVDGDAAHGAPEMHVVMTWRNYLRMREGQVTALEGIEQGGTVDARWTLLLLLHGLLQEPEYVRLYRSLPAIPAELGWWGEVAPWIPARDSF